jgi:hypothetical protein
MKTIRPKKESQRAGDERSIKRRSIRELTRCYFANEESWEVAIEIFLFAVMATISTWQMWVAIDYLHDFRRHVGPRQNFHNRYATVTKTSPPDSIHQYDAL